MIGSINQPWFRLIPIAAALGLMVTASTLLGSGGPGSHSRALDPAKDSAVLEEGPAASAAPDDLGLLPEHASDRMDPLEPSVPDASSGAGGSGVTIAQAPRPVTIQGPALGCTRDVTAGLLHRIALVPNGTTIRFEKGACYRIDGTLRINDRRGLTFEGNGAVFKAVAEGDQARRHFWFWGGSNITIRNLTVIGANPHAGTSQAAYRSDREFQHAFAFQGTSNVLLENVRAYDVYGDFVYLGPDQRNGARWSRDITIRNSRFERNGRQGIAITAAEDVTISKNYLGDIRRATFDLEPTKPSWGARNIRIVNNTTGRGRLLWLASGGQGFNVSDIYIAGNTMKSRTGTPVIKVIPPDNGAASPALTDDLRGPFIIENNLFIAGGSTAPGFHFLHSADVIFRNNRVSFPAKREMTAVRVRESHTVRVTDNIFRGAARSLDADSSSVGCLEANNQT